MTVLYDLQNNQNINSFLCLFNLCPHPFFDNNGKKEKLIFEKVSLMIRSLSNDICKGVLV